MFVEIFSFLYKYVRYNFYGEGDMKTISLYFIIILIFCFAQIVEAKNSCAQDSTKCTDAKIILKQQIDRDPDLAGSAECIIAIHKMGEPFNWQQVADTLKKITLVDTYDNAGKACTWRTLLYLINYIDENTETIEPKNREEAEDLAMGFRMVILQDDNSNNATIEGYVSQIRTKATILLGTIIIVDRSVPLETLTNLVKTSDDQTVRAEAANQIGNLCKKR
jgi:hypothetical protein